MRVRRLVLRYLSVGIVPERSKTFQGILWEDQTQVMEMDFVKTTWAEQVLFGRSYQSQWEVKPTRRSRVKQTPEGK